MKAFICFLLLAMNGFLLAESDPFDILDSRSRGPKTKKAQARERKSEAVQLNQAEKELQELEQLLRENRAALLLLQGELRQKQGTDNDLRIDVELRKGVNLEGLTARLDGLLLFEAAKKDEVLLNAKRLPLFIGPMGPGKHKLEVTGLLTTGAQGAAQDVNLAYEVDVPAGSLTGGWLLEFWEEDGKLQSGFVFKKAGS